MNNCKKHQGVCIPDTNHAFFRLTCKQQQALEKFQNEQDKLVAQKQGGRYPNYGASGGGYTYSFSPCGIGTAVKVKNELTKNELDISFYEDW